MKKSEEMLQVAMIAVIMGETFAKKLYDKMRLRDDRHIPTWLTIGSWAILFFNKHKKTNWDETLDKGMIPMSSEIKSIENIQDAVLDFGYVKLKEY